ncbi:MAG: transglutaminase-like domain-containing protein [Planctomycetota bacterium]|jgi:hypothetical protein|nr:transglutaminase-like domain-containing protein [Planctomycetota bacterium]
MSAASAILKLIADEGDPATQDHLANQLREDGDLLAAVWRLATEAGEPPPALIHLVLGIDAPELIARYRIADLEAGTWLLCWLDQPRRDHAGQGGASLDALAERCNASTASEVATYLRQQLGITGDRIDYHHPANSFMHRVLERRCGLPITLTVLWMLLCQRLGFTAEALCLPGHVVGRWDGGFLDLFEGGNAIDDQHIDRMCLAGGFVDPARFLEPASERDLLQRMARNLVYAYRKREDAVRAEIATALS